jgi:hypothetical protein
MLNKENIMQKEKMQQRNPSSRETETKPSLRPERAKHLMGISVLPCQTERR